MNQFNVGDIVRANVDTHYHITHHKVTCEVIKVWDGLIEVKVMQGRYKGKRYLVRSNKFHLENGKECPNYDDVEF